MVVLSKEVIGGLAKVLYTYTDRIRIRKKNSAN